EYCDATVSSSSSPSAPPPSYSSATRHRRSKRHQRTSSSPVDTIDRLDHVLSVYHHDGPFEATLAYRNNGIKDSPVDAVARSTAQTLDAIPPGSISDALRNHTPMDGVAVVPPGCYVPGRPDGLHYEEEVLSSLDQFRLPIAASSWPGEDFSTAPSLVAVDRQHRRSNSTAVRSSTSS
ncbi:uncharacterized protein V1516DRAFT_611568, partial [Lipomyces oligophaga]|uniref:uncharacterized protein n=1 Tax=Lipomyces oligophaga TaxID=45792 RepID=UPI0034CDB129